MSDNKVLDLDFLLEPVKPAGKVQLCGQTYNLFQADLVENFLALTAMIEKAAPGDEPVDPATLAADMERLRQEFRNMIKILVPDFPDEVLHQKFPKLDQLRQVFTILVMEVQKNLPENVKKNSGSASIDGPNPTLKPTIPNADPCLSPSAESAGSTASA